MEEFSLNVRSEADPGQPDLSAKKTKSLVPVGSKVLWLLNKKEYTKENDEKPFSKWTSLTGGTLLIDDERVLRKEVFKLLSE